MGLTEPPQDDEVEVSLFGPGKGEAVVVHVGAATWIIVDSCRDAQSGTPAPLSYLNTLGASPSSVALIVATHWHDDHIRGLGEVVEACPKADFIFSQMLKRDQFLELVVAGRRSLMTTAGTSEFSSVLQVLEQRKRRTGRQPRQFAMPNRVIWERGPDQIRTLSPPDAGIDEALRRLAQFLPEARETKRRIGDVRPNDASIVLWIRVGDVVALLGGDLERRRSVEMGWRAILNAPVAVPSRASLFKVPHHGAATGHDDRVWSELLEADPVAVLTPYSPSQIPTVEDQQRLCRLSAAAFLSAPNQPGGRRSRSAVVDAMISGTATYLHDAEPPTGHIRARRRIRRSAVGGDAWTIEVFPPAHDMCAALPADPEPAPKALSGASNS